MGMGRLVTVLVITNVGKIIIGYLNWIIGIYVRRFKSGLQLIGGAIVLRKSWIHPIFFSWNPLGQYQYDEPDTDDDTDNLLARNE